MTIKEKFKKINKKFTAIERNFNNKIKRKKCDKKIEIRNNNGKLLFYFDADNIYKTLKKILNIRKVK